MQETLCNLCIVTIIGNLAATCAIPVAGIFWFLVGPAIQAAYDKDGVGESPAREYPRERPRRAANLRARTCGAVGRE